MKKPIVAFVIGALFLWFGSAHADPAESTVLGGTSIFSVDFSGNVPFGKDVTGANDFSIYHSVGLGGRRYRIQEDGFVTPTVDGGRTSDPIGSHGFGFPCPVGWLNSPGKNQGWKFAIHLGLVHHIPPEVEMTAAGRILLNGLYEETLVGTEKQLAEQLGNFDYYPILSFGLRYHF